ncbi:hypothetical protein HYT84_02215 [Candidatus Micrarchaeota archaeon]|nr:hypothetical protein [Candidatus Micrarchaeota archaeon]
MELVKDKKFIIMSIILLAAAFAIVNYPRYSGLLLISSLITFGALSLIWKEPKFKVAGLVMLVILSMLNIGVNGIKFGIDFSGGTRIPVLLEQSVDQTTMSELVQTIKARASVLGLTEVKVRSIGDSEIDVEIPSSDPEQITFIEEILSHQGVYTGVVDGKIAISGENIYSNSIRPVSSSQSNADWAVGFLINKEGAEHFAKTVKGKANYPLYMFLDRPNDVIIVLSKDELKKNAPIGATEKDLVKAVEKALEVEENTIPVLLFEESDGELISEGIDLNSSAPNKSKAIVSDQISSKMKDTLIEKGYKLVEKPAPEMELVYQNLRSNEYIVSEWKAIGLLSSPLLAASVTDGVANYNYLISGSVQSAGQQKVKEINENVKRIESVLKGGSLPVQISLGSRTVLPASLGAEFLNISLIGIVISLILISIFIGLRYMRINVILPIVLISISELMILLSVLGSFTIDLAETAEKLEERAEHAFSIIKTNIVVAIMAMVPLLFSGLVEVIGFAISTMLGALLGYLLSRPAYGFVVEKVAEK